MPIDAAELLAAETLASPSNSLPAGLPHSAGETTDPLEADTLEWAKDVMWLRHNLNVKKTEAKKWSGFRFALWSYATVNTADYVSQMLPKATAIIERAKAKAPDATAIIEAETKSIAEISAVLDAAIQEANAS